MKKVEILELSKKKSNDNCCIFCESKCAKCGSVDIDVRYQRFYKFDNEKMIFDKSYTKVFCIDCANSAKTLNMDLPGPSSVEKFSLGKQIDLIFEDNKTRQISSEMKTKIKKDGIEYFMLIYLYENNTRDHIKLEYFESHCLDKNRDIKKSDIADILDSMFHIASVSLDCKTDPDNPGSHFVINATEDLVI